jgi:predicted nucleic acid-binding protein
MGWVGAQASATLYTHSLAIAEIRAGIDRVADPALRGGLTEWLEARVRPLFAGRILEMDEMAWLVLLRIVVRTKAVNRTTPVSDLILAASAERHGLIVVTRNVRDFAGTGVRVLNPWLIEPVIEIA